MEDEDSDTQECACLLASIYVLYLNKKMHATKALPLENKLSGCFVIIVFLGVL